MTPPAWLQGRELARFHLERGHQQFVSGEGEGAPQKTDGGGGGGGGEKGEREGGRGVGGGGGRGGGARVTNEAFQERQLREGMHYVTSSDQEELGSGDRVMNGKAMRRSLF